MVNLTNFFQKFKKINVLVIGDFMLDKYTFGTVKRISPEAPVPIVKVENIKSTPGGAGNVVLNLLSLKANVRAIGRVGKDHDGKILLDYLKKKGADVENIFYQKDYPTSVKNRLLASNQQIARIDHEKTTPILNEIEKDILKKLPGLFEGIQAVAISDYDKGFLSRNLLKAVIDLSNKKNIPCIVDPKGLDFSKYKNANFIKPNLLEAYTASNLSFLKSLKEVAKYIIDITKTKNLIITRSEKGITLFDKDIKRKDFSVVSKEVKDGTGAGDTVLATLAVCLGNNFSIDQSIIISNIAAGIAIEHIGCMRVEIFDIANRLLELNSENKIFTTSNLFALKEVLETKKYKMLQVDSKEGISMFLFKSISKIVKKGIKLVVYVKDKNPDEEFISVLSSFKDVDFIIKKENYENLYIKPIQSYEIKDNVLCEI